MNTKRFFASSVAGLALLSFVGMTSVAGADPTSSHSGKCGRDGPDSDRPE